MELTNKTKLKDLLTEYPWLKEEIVKINHKFKLLNTPLAKVMFEKADLTLMSKKSGIEINVLIEELQKLIASRE